MTIADLSLSDAWTTTYPGSAAGILVMRDARNPAEHAELDERKAALEADLRARYGGVSRAELRELPVLHAYAAYYKRFNKTYHVQLQLESVAHKGKTIPAVAALVEAMFMAELKNQLLTAGHDLAAVALPLRLDIAAGGETYTLANGQPGQLKPGDMYMADAEGVICSVIYGQDQRTRLTADTRDAMFVVYAPPGIEAATVEAHLRDIAEYVRVVAPQASIEWLVALTA
jgi:DNA/RNA-binding domain of Phe-tRNA-synthetase-like protein